MSSNRYPPQPAAMARRLGQHLLLSLGVTTATALLATLPALLSGAPVRHGAARASAAPPAMAAQVQLRDGKIVDRLGGTAVAGSEMDAAGLSVAPAALAMPMSLSWPEGGAWTPVQRLAGMAPKLRIAQAPTLAPPRRGASPPVHATATAGPLVILPPAAATALEAIQVAETARDDSPRDDAWNRLVTQPATKVVDAVSGAAGSVQATGSWGLSQAANLLPRW